MSPTGKGNKNRAEKVCPYSTNAGLSFNKDVRCGQQQKCWSQSACHAEAHARAPRALVEGNAVFKGHLRRHRVGVCAAMVGSPSTGLDVERELLARAGANAKDLLPLIIFFTASWCGPCRLVDKELNKLMAFHKHIKVLSVDVDVEKEFATKLGIKSMPTLLFVGTAPASSPAIATQGKVSSAMIWDIVETKLQLAGADLSKPRRL